MPEPSWPKRKGSSRLSDAAKDVRDSYASIRYTYCKRQRFYTVADLFTAFGDMECTDLIRVAGFRCRRCDGKCSLDFRLGGPPGDIADKICAEAHQARPVYAEDCLGRDLGV